MAQYPIGAVRPGTYVPFNPKAATGVAATDLASLQAAIAATPAGGVCRPAPGSYSINDALTIAAALTLDLTGVTITQTTTVKKGLVITASGVTVVRPTIIGPRFNVYNDTERGVEIKGASAAAPISDITLIEPNISSWGGYGIITEFAHKVTVKKPKVTNIAYGGIIFLSGDGCVVESPDVDMGNPVGTSANAYGISFSRNTGISLAAQPRSTNGTVVGGVVRNVQLWHALDTHGGENIQFLGVTALNCLRGIHIGPSNDSAAVSTYAPKRCVADVVVDSQVTDGTRDSGVIVSGAMTGATVNEYAEGCEVRATVKGHGSQSVGTMGAVWAVGTRNLVLHIVAIECSPNSVSFQGNNLGFTLGLNSVDPWSTSSGRGTHVFVAGDNNVGTVSPYTLIRGTKSATNVDTDGFRVDNNAGNSVQLGTGHVSSTTPIIDPGGKVMAARPSEVSLNAGLGYSPGLRDQYLKPNAAKVETITRMQQINNLSPVLTSGTLYLVAIALPKGMVVSNLSLMSSGAATSPTNWWMGLFDASRNALALSADQLTASWAGATIKTLPVATIASGAASSFMTTYTGLHYLGVCMVATTAISLFGAPCSTAVTGAAPVVFGGSTSGLTGPPTFPFTGGLISVVNAIPYGYVG